jgi:hypothetical protein
MTQLSRPFQIALVALALLVLVWFGALHRPGSGSSGSASPTQPTASSSAAHSHSGTVSHSSVHVTTSTGHHAKTSAGHITHVHVHATHVTVHARHATGGGSSASGSPGSAATGKTSASANGHLSTPGSGPGASTRAPHKVTVDPRATQPARGPVAAAKTPSAPALQAAVAGELKHGKVVLLLFWNPRSSDDAVVHRQVQAVAHKLGGRVVVHTAAAGQVGSFGSITRDIQIYQTPTLLIVNPKKQVTTVTGYTEAFAIEQAIREARG